MWPFAAAKAREAQAEVDPVTGAVVEDAASRAAGLAALRAALAAAQAADASIRLPRDDDRFLLAFLRARKYRVSKACEVCLSFAKFWYAHPDIVNGLCAKEVRAVWSLGLMGFLPASRDVHGNTVTVLRMGAFDMARPGFVETYTAANMLRLSLYILCMLFDSDEMQLHGACYVETLEGFSLLNMLKLSGLMSAADQKELMSAGVDTFPMRIRDIYVVKQPAYFSVFWALVKPFLKAKLTKRLHLLGDDLPALHKLVDPAGLPADFGGALPLDLGGFLDELEAREAGGIGERRAGRGRRGRRAADVRATPPHSSPSTSRARRTAQGASASPCRSTTRAARAAPLPPSPTPRAPPQAPRTSPFPRRAEPAA